MKVLKCWLGLIGFHDGRSRSSSKHRPDHAQLEGKELSWRSTVMLLLAKFEPRVVVSGQQHPAVLHWQSFIVAPVML